MTQTFQLYLSDGCEQKISRQFPLIIPNVLHTTFIVNVYFSFISLFQKLTVGNKCNEIKQWSLHSRLNAKLEMVTAGDLENPSVT